MSPKPLQYWIKENAIMYMKSVMYLIWQNAQLHQAMTFKSCFVGSKSLTESTENEANGDKSVFRFDSINKGLKENIQN